jgi:peptidoglycan/LPS O-acetylase OafA/YrhL
MSPAARPGARIGVLDGYRALAIALVLGFHYFTRWTPPHNEQNYYPYGDALARVPLFVHGYLGVQLFFIVSGFVISMTLLGCRDWLDFAGKRFARLFPTMLLCSVLTYAVLRLVPLPVFPVQPRDFLPSLTFTEPELWSRAFGAPFRAIDGAYWSLQVEVKFYFWAALLYFSGARPRFALRFAALCAAVLAAQALAAATGARLLASLVEELFFPEYLPWFAAGVGFHGLYRDHRDRLGAWLVGASAAVLVGRWLLAPQADPVALAFSLAFYVLFGLFVLRPRWVAAFGSAPMVAVGAASYSLYLLHQDIGVRLLALAQGAGLAPGWSSLWVAAVLVAAMTALAMAVYRGWELPAKNRLLGWQRRLRGTARDSAPG